MQLALPSRWKPKIDGSPIPPRRTWRFQKCCTPVWLVFSNTTRMRCWVLPGSVQPSGNMTPSLRGKKQSPMSDYGHSDGRYAPIGNTSSVIDGEPSHALRALLLRIWRAVLLLLSAVASSCPDVLMYPDPAQLSSSKELPSTHYFRDAQPYFRTRNSIRNSYRILAPSYRENTLVSKQLPCQAGIEDQRNKAQLPKGRH